MRSEIWVSRLLLIAGFLTGAFFFDADRAVAATVAGTVIYSTSTASYSNANNNSFSTTSNTITATVQNAPVMTMSTPGAQNISIGVQVVDTFTFTNTGNATGTFALTGNATFGGTASAPTLAGYVLNGVSSGTCSTATPCSVSTLNSQAGMASITAGTGTATVGVAYTATSTSQAAQTIQTSLTATVAYASLTGAAAETSASVTSTPTDTVYEPRIDVQETASTPGSSGAALTWTIKANNGGNAPAYSSLVSNHAIESSATNTGIPVIIKMPTYNSAVLGMTGTPTVTASGLTSVILYGLSSGVPGQYSGNGSCATLWCTTYNANATWVAAYIMVSSGGSTSSAVSTLASASGNSSGAGSVTTAQATITITTNQPSGTGSANSNSVSNMANALANDPNSYLIGPGIAVATADTSSASPATTDASATANNATPSSTTVPPGGASNSASTQAYAAYAVLNGPYANAGATGLYPGASGSADNMHDFTAYDMPCTSNSATSVNGIACTLSGTGVIIINEVSNSGNVNDAQVQITATAPTGYKVQLYAASSCSGGGSTWPSCTQGSSLTSQSSDGGSVNATVSVNSGATYDYEAVYNATGNSATAFTAYTTTLTATGQNGSGTGADTNNTYNTLYPGGIIELTNSVTATTTNCPAGESAPPSGVACPGGTLSYGIAYVDVVPAAVGSNLGTEPAFAYASCYTSAGSLVITNDSAAFPSGATAANNWATYTNAIAAAATDTTANTVITYYPSASATFSANQTKLTAQIGGASYQLAPGGSGTVTFTAVVK